MNYFLPFFFFAISLFATPVLEKIALTEKSDFSFDEKDYITIEIPCKKEVIKEKIATFLGRPITKETLVDIKVSIAQALSEEDNSLFFLSIPEQNISKGNLIISAKCTRAKKVKISKNRWFSKNDIQNSLKLSKEKRIYESDLLNSTSWVNRNPFIQSQVLLASRAAPYVNIEVEAYDRFPARFYLGADNTGTSFSGNERFFTGVMASLRLNALVTYQFTSGYDFPEFFSHSGSLTVFLPWKHELLLFGGYATLHPHISHFESKGKDIQVSGRYTIPVKPLYTSFQQQYVGGIDYKRTDSALFFLGALPSGAITRIPVSQKASDLFQFYFAYQVQDKKDTFSISFKGEAFLSPFEFLPDQTAARYDSLRPNAKTHYLYARTTLGITYPFAKSFAFTTLFRGQIATGPLLPSEQFALGGLETVRGYQERIYLADDCLLGNFELHFPTLHFFKDKRDALVFLTFLDVAYGLNRQASLSYPQDTWLIGIGPGLRYTISPYLSLKADYGFRTHNPPFSNSQIGRFHFALTVGY